MKTVIVSVAAVALAAALIVGAFIYLGIFNVAADDPHWPVTYRIMETARVRSIATHAASIQAPPDLDDHARIVAGTSHFSEHCSACHSAPGVEADDMAEGMYPKPPTLIAARLKWTPSELFWIVKHGIKMSGMPSWADHSDDDLWNTVAFLEQLPGMSQADYERLVEESKAGGHAMHGNMPMRMDGAGGPPAPSFEEKP
jgi:mono/diheme cytochrome c family protein